MAETEEPTQILTSSDADETPKSATEESMGNCTKAQRDGCPKFDYSLEKSVVHDTFLKSGKIAKALIITYPDKKVQVSGPPDFQPPPRAIKNILNAIEGRTSALAEEGIDLGEGKVYVPGKCEKGVSIYGTCPEGGGCIIYKTPMSLIVAVYTADQNPSMANRLVLETADVMAEEEDARSGKRAVKPAENKPEKKASDESDEEEKCEVNEEHNEYEKTIVKDTLLKGGKLTKALIFGYKDRTIHYTEPSDFLPPADTVDYIVQALEGDTVGLAENGIDLGEDGKVYVPGKVEEGAAIVGVSPHGGGCVIYKTTVCVIIGVYSANQNPSMANRLVLETSDFMKDDGR